MTPPPTARALALEALRRIDEGAYANLIVAELLGATRMERRDRALATDLVYGITRMRRALDWRIDRYARGPLDGETRRVLRLGAYQIAHLRIPPHAAVGETVGLAPARSRGLVNAVLRRVAADADAGNVADWPDEATRLSYPDWIVERLTADLGADLALATLEHLDAVPSVTERDDGYVQDRASQWVAEFVGAQPGERVLDLCAAPGGKATAMAASGATVIAGDIRAHRAKLIRHNAKRLRARTLHIVGADGTEPPFRPRSFDRVLVDAPCSGLGVLHRRPDARWRIEQSDLADLTTLQQALIEAAIGCVRPDGVLVYSVCTLTDAESIDHDVWLANTHPELTAIVPPSAPWQSFGRGARLLPQTAGTDGMCVFAYRCQNVEP